MQIEIWSDIGCPFCYIGKRRFEAALEQFAHQGEVQVQYRSFQLDPHAAKNPDYDLYDMLSKKMGRSREEVKQMNQQLANQAREVGLDFRFGGVIPANSEDAHRLIKLAEQLGKGPDMWEALYKAYFTDAKHIGDTDTLLALAEEVGIDRQEAAALLQSDKFIQEVHEDGREASRFGATGVPFYVINRKYAVSGAQPSEVFLQALKKVWEEENPATKLESLSSEPGDVCADGSCGPSRS
ncbi:DsbA family oxidoreductase [Paenibacillus senegalensis]|uniref:DsbA family oxidoreductase n=1 Tax=Paenibacillus senegalensis TaxID=1465766 RepID=UPI0002E7195B